MSSLGIKAELNLFNEYQLSDMAKAAKRLASELAFRIQGTAEFFDLLSSFGCDINGESVRISPAVVDKVCDRMASEKSTRNIDGGPSRSKDGDGVSLFTHGQALYVCDAHSNELRPATTPDLEVWCRIVDALGITERSHPTFIPQDVPTLAASFHAFATIILNSRKPHRVSVFSAKMLPFFIEAWRIAEGPGKRVDTFTSPELRSGTQSPERRPPVFATKCWVNSPFMITRENVEIAMEARRLLGRPIEFGVMPVAGASTPVTVPGALVQNTAESILLSAFRLATDDLLHPLDPTAALLDMAGASHRQSGPDLLLHSVAASQMHAYLTGEYRRPYYHTGVAAKVVSPQSLYEKAFTASMAVAFGLRNLGVGCLAYSDVGSPVQLVLDKHMGEHLSAHFAPVSMEDNRIDVDDILRVVPTGARYLESANTAEYFRESLWMQDFIDHRPVMTWVNDPTDMVKRAQARAIELIESAENQCELSDEKCAGIRQLMKDADRCARSG